MELSFFRFVTYNIHGGADPAGQSGLPRIAETLRALAPDLAGLQEVDRVFRPRSEWADQPAELGKSLGMAAGFAPGIDRRPWGYGGKFGNAILSRWPVEGWWRLKLPSRREQRVLLGAEVIGPAGRIHFLTCHLGLAQAERAEQIEAILTILRQLEGPLALSGDFNARPDAPELAPLFAGWQEVQTTLGLDQPTYPAANARIDYLFCTPHWRIRQARVLSSSASDHWPLAADVSLIDPSQGVP